MTSALKSIRQTGAVQRHGNSSVLWHLPCAVTPCNLLHRGGVCYAYAVMPERQEELSMASSQTSRASKLARDAGHLSRVSGSVRTSGKSNRPSPARPSPAPQALDSSSRRRRRRPQLIEFRDAFMGAPSRSRAALRPQELVAAGRAGPSAGAGAAIGIGGWKLRSLKLASVTAAHGGRSQRAGSAGDEAV